jgi:hypothetical protein
MYRERTPDHRHVGPVYSAPTITTTDIDTWLSNNGNVEVPTQAVAQGKGLIGTLYEATQLRPAAFGFAIDLKPIFGFVRRYLSSGRN